MSRMMRPTIVRHAVFGLAVCGLAISSLATAQAGDLNGPVYSPYPYGAANEPRVYEREGVCRIILQRRIDPYGREIVHRVRMCDEGPVYVSPNPAATPPEYGYPPPRYYEPSPSGYDPYPRPPAPIGPGYYN
jgi:hypothetical protein